MDKKPSQYIEPESTDCETDTQQAQPSSEPLNASPDYINFANGQLSQLNFPRKLHRILSTQQFNDIICWLPHGRSWRVQQQQRFEKEVLPIFFRHGRYASFARQINGWGFRRMSSGPDFNSYYHEYFLRDAPDLCLRMRRPSAAELADRKRSEPDSPPNFYLMPNETEDNTTPMNTDDNADDDEDKSVNLQRSPHRDSAVASEQSEHLSLQGDGYMRNLIHRIVMLAPQQQNLILQLEMRKLKVRREEIERQLQRLRSLEGNSDVLDDANNNRIHAAHPSTEAIRPQILTLPSINQNHRLATDVVAGYRTRMHQALTQHTALQLLLRGQVPFSLEMGGQYQALLDFIDPVRVRGRDEPPNPDENN